MFTNTVMLAGLGGAAVPVVIHLLNRSRYRTVNWGAMMFLEAQGSSKTEDVGRVREMILLGLRMGIVALLAMALARPVAAQQNEAASEPGQVTAAIVVDCSASMAHEDGGISRMAAARSAVLRVLSGLRRGDQVCLIPTGAGAPQAQLFTGDHQSVANRVSDLKASAGGADLGNAIPAAVDALERQQGGGKRLFLICDHQAQSWAGVDDETAADCKRRLAHMQASFAVIPVGSDSAENVSIESVAVANPPAVAFNGAQLDVQLHNFGQLERLAVPVRVRIDGGDEQPATVNLGGQQSQTLSLPVKFAGPGWHVVTAEIQGGGGDVDDHRDAVIDVAEPIRTLIVRDRERSGADYLRAALMPHAMAKMAGGDVAQVEIVTADEWDETALDQYQVLILDDVAALTAAQAQAVEQFVYGGGGLIVAPGPAAQTTDYNRMLYREETAMLPALLQPAVSPPLAQRIDASTVDASHPAMRFLADHAGGLPVLVDRFFPVTGRTAGARVLANLSGGDPLLIEGPFGDGRVMLITCPLDARWSSMPLTNVYLPLVQSMVRFVSGAAPAQHNVTAGQELVATFSGAPAGARATIIRPDGSRDQAEVMEVEGGSEVRYAQTQLAGVYTIRVGPRGHEQTAMFATAPPPEESDLSPLTQQRWKDLAAQFGFDRVSDARRVNTSAASIGGEYWLALLAGVIGLLVIEMALTGSWWRGAMTRGRRVVGGLR